MTEQHKWNIEGRDVFIDRWSDNGLETMTIEEAEIWLNEYEKLKKATEALSAEDAKLMGNQLGGHGHQMEAMIIRAYADILDTK